MGIYRPNAIDTMKSGDLHGIMSEPNRFAVRCKLGIFGLRRFPKQLIKDFYAFFRCNPQSKPNARHQEILCPIINEIEFEKEFYTKKWCD